MIQSMTGFGSADGLHEFPSGMRLVWRWEAKTVNGRGLDLRVRLPSGFERIEPALRSQCTSLLRGTLTATLTAELTGGAGSMVIDDAALDAVLDAADKIQARRPDTVLSADGILGLRGILSVAEPVLSSEELQTADALLLDGFVKTVSALKSAREEEGRALLSALVTLLDDIAKATDEARLGAAEATAAHHKNLKDQLADLLESTELDEARLSQEVAMLATKSDIREELDRLDGHVSSARATLKKAGAVGRSLDFIAQELMREANTLTVKSPTLEAKNIGLSLKQSIDQFKEQVQNVA